MLNEFEKKVLAHFGLDEEGYSLLTSAPSFSSLPLFEDHSEVDKMIARLEKARSLQEKVIIYGDYDTDGVMATSITKIALERFGIIASTYLPSRYLDGYGINLNNAKKIVEAGYQLVVCVDNGVSAYEAADYLAEHGVDLLIIDHHEIQEQGIAKSFACIHPETCHYGEEPVSAGYLCFLFSVYLNEMVDPYLLILGATSTLSDMMPLRSHNRTIVRLAVELLNQKNYPPYHNFLEKRPITANDLSMSFIPAINAIGRMVEDSTINRLIPYFTLPYDAKMEAVGRWMKAINEQRKTLTKEAATLYVDPDSPSICLLTNLKEGLNGLVANRILGEYDKVTCILSPKANDPSLLVGSIRAKEGFDVMKAMTVLKPYLLAGGGHALAGGVTIKKDDFAAFKKTLDYLALQHQFNAAPSDLIPLQEEDVTLANAYFIESLGPFGQGWKAPRFHLPNVKTASLSFSQKSGMLMTRFPSGWRLFSFSLDEKSFMTKKEVDLEVSFRVDCFRGHSSVELLAEKIL